MNDEGKNHLLIPALIAAIAAYFGFRKKSECLSAVAQDLVGRAIKDQTELNHKIKSHKRLTKWRNRRRK
jgi:hypothetical protein